MDRRVGRPVTGSIFLLDKRRLDPRLPVSHDRTCATNRSARSSTLRRSSKRIDRFPVNGRGWWRCLVASRIGEATCRTISTLSLIVSRSLLPLPFCLFLLVTFHTELNNYNESGIDRRECVCVCTHTQVRLIYDGGGSIDILATRPNSSASEAEDRYPGCLAVYVDHVARIWPPPEAEFKRLTRAVRRE